MSAAGTGAMLWIDPDPGAGIDAQHGGMGRGEGVKQTGGPLEIK